MSDKAEVEKVAQKVAERFAETGDRPRQQIERMVKLMGQAWVNDIADQAARELASAGPLTLKADGTPRAKSGVFFAIARRTAFELLGAGTLKRKDFYATFCWRERKPREPRPAPAPKPPKAAAPRPAFSAKPKQPQGSHAPRRKAPPPAEIYSVRRPIR